MSVNTYVSCAIALAAVSVASATPTPKPGTCVVDLSNTPYSSLAIRSAPCNNQPVIVYLRNNQVVQNLGQTRSGCGYDYVQVTYVNKQGRQYTGWVGSDYVVCAGNKATQTCGAYAVKNGGPTNACGPNAYFTADTSAKCLASGSNCQSVCCAAIPRPAPVAQQSCGSFSVKNGGPSNACGSGYRFTADDGDMCAADGSNCQSLCCSPNKLYRRGSKSSKKLQTCGAFAVKNGGPTNACGDDAYFTADDSAKCLASGKNCHKVCCVDIPAPEPAATQSCGLFAVKNGGPTNACGSGYRFTAADSNSCLADGSNCQDRCCTPNKLFRHQDTTVAP